MDERVQLRLAIQTGLLTNITPAMRVICVDMDDGVIRLSALLEREPTQEEEEMLLDAALDAAGDFPRVMKAEVRCVVESRSMADLMGGLHKSPLGYVVYARHEKVYG